MTPIEHSTAIAIKKAKTGLSNPAAATSKNLAEVGNRPIASPSDRIDLGHSGRPIVNIRLIDVGC
jgi:hypothetical protein